MFDPLQKFAQKRPDTGQQDFQVSHVAPFFLGHTGNQFQFAGQQGNGIKHADGFSIPLRLNCQRVHRTRNTRNPPDHFNVGFQAADLERNDSGQRGHFHLGRITRSQFQLPGNALDISADRL